MSRDRSGQARPGPGYLSRSLVRRHVRYLGPCHTASRSCALRRRDHPPLARFRARPHVAFWERWSSETMKSVKWHIAVRRIVTALSHKRLQSFVARSSAPHASHLAHTPPYGHVVILTPTRLGLVRAMPG